VVDLINGFITCGMVERFWDIINTFQLPLGEMTAMPFDFTMLMGLGFKERLFSLSGGF